MTESLQQHDLKPAVARNLVAAAQITDTTQVLDVGAGTGNLTEAILATGAKVQAIELDPQRAKHLRERFAPAIDAGRLQVWVGDALIMHPAVNPDWQVIANPPFQHTSELLRKWLLEDLPGGPPAAIDLILQDQAARKIRGLKGKNSRLGILANLFGTTSVTVNLNKDDTVPPSRVPLACLHIRRQKKAPTPATLRRVDNILEIAFAGPHTVREALRKIATPKILKRQAATNQWDPDAHPRTLSPRAWLALTEFLMSIGKI